MAWTVEQRCFEQLTVLQPWCDVLRQAVALETSHAGELARLEDRSPDAAHTAQRAMQRVQAVDTVLAEQTDRIRDGLLAAWDAERGTARAIARLVLDGPGWWGLKRAPVARAGEQLAGWADRWRPHLPGLPTDPEQLARVADRFDDRQALWRAFHATARRAAEREHPEHATLHAAAEAARRTGEQARAALAEAQRCRAERLDPLGPLAWAPDPAGRLADVERSVATTRHELAAARTRIADLQADPVFAGQLPDRLTAARDAWRAHHDADRQQRRAIAPGPTGYPTPVPWPESERHGPRSARGVTPSLRR
ncbi:hypothetical protein JOD57_003167 [Geodermatophilus bullaregiensis]|uniref:FUSC family protein n=1 Tax=Geodermatophilus bullaregiensis TaxID=1564160 RepID=UPI001EF8E5BC|nr:FUSC family protein [Geodermatophilus bullaregiensis]MBM7807330.1 hypothetical protein [Geodermatophilus bullaregiensis]